MKNPAPYIRKAFSSLLNPIGVPVYESEGKEGVSEQIILAGQNWTDRSTKHSFTGTFEQTIEVVTETKGFAARKRVDEIGEQVMNLVQPTPRSTGLVETEFQFIGLRKDGQTYLVEDGNAGNRIVRLILRYSFIVNQINV